MSPFLLLFLMQPSERLSRRWVPACWLGAGNSMGEAAIDWCN
jgi:hypothetical protein